MVRTISVLFSLLVCFNLLSEKRDTFFSSDKLTSVGVYYYPEHWDSTQWERDLKRISQMGFEFTHYAEFAWAALEPKEGIYNFQWLDRAIALADKYDLKVILCTSTATPPVWLTRKHPEILIQNEDGTYFDHGARQHASFSSSFYREYAKKIIDELGRRYGNDDRIIGWQIDNEPAVRMDFSPGALLRFREFLQKKYNNDIDALNSAWGAAFWGQTYSDFDEITFPRYRGWGKNPHQVLDHKRFTVNETATFLDEQAAVLHKYASPRQFITTNYIPSFEDGHIGKSKELDFNCYTRYMVSGRNEDLGIGKKGYRIGDPLRIALANDFFRPIDGYYGVMELQPGQVNWGEYNAQQLPGAVRLWLWSVFAGGSDFTCTYRFRQPLVGNELYHYGIVGTDGITPSRGGEEFSRFISEINILRKNYKQGKNISSDYYKRYAAILYNAENAWSLSTQRQSALWNTQTHFENYYRPLKSFGAKVDVISEEKDFIDYPVLIAPAYTLVDDSLISRWHDYVVKGGNLVLSVRTAYKDRNDRLFELPVGGKLFDLIGAKMDFFDLIVPSDTGTVVVDDSEYTWSSWGEIFTPYENTEIWGIHKGDFYAGKSAVLHRKLGKGTVTYIGVDSHDGALEKAVLKKLYSLLKIPVLNLPEGVWFECRDGFGVALNYSPETYQFPLDEDTEILIGSRNIPTAGVLVWRIKD
ncbi:MAG: beta-galactosidase [Bacteroidales bacterium]|nr:beta-galactosidase [Bacteroidales bacterium]